MQPKSARFSLKDVVLPASTANEIREALIKVRYSFPDLSNMGL